MEKLTENGKAKALSQFNFTRSCLAANLSHNLEKVESGYLTQEDYRVLAQLITESIQFVSSIIDDVKAGDV